MMVMDQVKQYGAFKDGRILALPCDKLADNPLRLEFYSQIHLEELTTSIKETGLLEPIIAWEQQEMRFIILSGHYRIRAVRRLRSSSILCHVIKCDRRTAHVIYCTSNLMTRGLSAIEEAHILSGLITREGFTMEQAGKLWGHSKSWVCRRMKLLTALDPRLKSELGKGVLSPRLAQELTRLPQGNEQERVLAQVRRHHLNKDEAAGFIDWWLYAGEEERKVVETGGRLSGIPGSSRNAGSPKTAVNHPEIYVASLIEHCTKTLKDLADFLKQRDKPFIWWPKACYRSFICAVDEVEYILRDECNLNGKESITNAPSIS